MPNVVLLCGAGASRADSKASSSQAQPPLDRGFFRECQTLGVLPTNFTSVQSYINEEFGYDILDPEIDSFEFAMSILYADMFTSQHSRDSYERFVFLVELLSNRLGQSTIQHGHRSTLESVIRLCFKRSQRQPSIGREEASQQFDVITFNYDIRIELALDAIVAGNARPSGFYFRFPDCYRIPIHYEYSLGSISSPVSPFRSSSQSSRRTLGAIVSGSAIDVLKLHGSLNWDSGHTSYPPAMNSILKKSRQISVTNAIELASLPYTLTRQNRRVNGFPVIVPPVYGKSSMIQNDIQDLWSRAEDKLTQADDLVVFGYSCPYSDQEARNLIRRCTAGRSASGMSKLTNVFVIDPDPKIAAVVSDLTSCDSVIWYKDVDLFLNPP